MVQILVYNDKSEDSEEDSFYEVTSSKSRETKNDKKLGDEKNKHKQYFIYLMYNWSSMSLKKTYLPT